MSQVGNLVSKKQAVILAVASFAAVLLFLVNSYLPISRQETNAAGNTCIWLGTTSESFSDATNWTDCSATTPDPTDTISFTSAATRNLSLTEDITVAGIQSLSASAFARTFDSNSFSVTVNGPFTWQAGTLTTDASLYTITGNLEISAGTFNYSTSNFTLSGAASNLTTKSDGTTSFYDLTIDKTDSATAVTIPSYDFNVRHYLNQKSGILDGAGRTITMSVDNSRYQIGANSGGGTASIKFSMTGYVDGSGGVANNSIELNGAAKTLYWNGSANIKFLTLTDGTLTIQSGKLTIPNDSANGKIACSAGKTLNLTGASAGQMVILRSDLAGSQWDLDKNATCTVNISYADIKDANNTDSASGDISTTNSINSTGNNGFAFATELTVNKWISDVESNWNNAANWSLGTVPTTTDSVYFGQGHDGNCNLDIAAGITVANFISTDYAGTFHTNDFNMIVVGGYQLNSGTFSSGSSRLNIQGKAGNFSGGVFLPGTSTVEFSGVTSQNNVQLITGASAYTHLEINKSSWGGAPGNIILLGEAIVNGNLLHTQGTLTGDSISLFGDYSIGTGARSARSACNINFIGSGDQVISYSEGGIGDKLIIDKPSGSLSVPASFAVNSWSYVRGSVAGIETLQLVGSDYVASFVPGNITYPNLTINKQTWGGANSTVTVFGTVTLTGVLTLTDGILNGGTIDLNGTLVSTPTFDGGNTTILVDGAGQVINLQDGWKLPAFELAAGTLNAPETGTVTFLNNFTNSGGTFNGNGATVEMGGNADFSAGTFNAEASIVKLSGLPTGIVTWTPGASEFNHVEIADTGNSGNNYDRISISGTAIVAGDLIQTSGKIINGQVNLEGNYEIDATATGSHGSTATKVNFIGSGAQTISSAAGGRGASIRIDKPSETLIISSDISITGFEYIQGSLSGLDTHTVSFVCTTYSTLNPGSPSQIFGGIVINKGNWASGYEKVTVTNPVTVNGDLTLIEGKTEGGVYNVAGNVAVQSTADSGTSAITLNGTENQTYTLSSGAMPTGTITIDKPSGNATFTGTGTINTNINVTQGNLDFAGGSTYTITAGKTITVASGQSLGFVGTSPTNMATVTSTGTWNLANAADSTISAKYVNVTYSNATNPVSAIYSTDSLNNVNWSFDTSTTRTWISDTTKNWNDPTAWDTGVPSATDFAVFNSTHVGDCTLSAHTTVGGIDNSGGYTGTLSTSASNYQLNVNGDFTWNSGTITANGSTISLGANVNLTGATYTIGTSTLKLTSTNDLMTYTTGDVPLKHLTIDGINGGWTAVGNLTLNSGNLTMTNGNFDAGTGTLDINDGSLTQNGGYFSTADTANTIERNLTRTAGTLDNQGKTITFDAVTVNYAHSTIDANEPISGTVAIKKIGTSYSSFTVSAGTVINLGDSPNSELGNVSSESGKAKNYGTIIVPSGTWTITGGNSSSVLSNYGNIAHTGTGWDIECSFINTGTVTYSGTDIIITRSLTQTGAFDLSGKTITFYTTGDFQDSTVTANGDLGGKVVLNKTHSYGRFFVSEGTSINLGESPTTAVKGYSGGGSSIENDGTIVVTSGTWNATGVGYLKNYGDIIHGGDGWVIGMGFRNGVGANVSYGGTSVTCTGSLYQDGNLLDWGAKEIRLTGTYYSVGGAEQIAGSLYLSSIRVTLESDLKVERDLVLNSGILNFNSFDLLSSGDVNFSSGSIENIGETYLLNTSALSTAFNGGTKTFNNIEIAPGPGELTFSGAFTFNNMTMSSEGIKPIKFTSGTTYTMTGDQFLTGNGSNLVTVTSTADGSPWTLSKSSGLILTDYVSLKDSHASGGAEFYALTNSTLVSNTDGWVLEDGAPDNPTTFNGYETSAKTVEISSEDWNNDSAIHFTWSGADDRAGSGVDGYYIYFGTDEGSDPTVASGIIEDDTSPHYQTGATYTLNKSMTSGTTYYFILKTKDVAGYISDSNSYFTYKYDNTDPTAPEFLSVEPAVCTTSYDFTFTWPEAEDEEGGSGISHYQYKKGSNGTLTNHQDTTLSETPYQDLDNVLYLRAVDNAGNASVWRTRVYCITGFITIEEEPSATSGPSSIAVSWRSSRATSAYVQIYEGESFITEQGTESLSQAHAVNVIGLKPEKSYRYRVVWADDNGNPGSLGWYEVGTATTPQVEDLKIELLTPNSILVNFMTNYTATATIEYGKESFTNSIPLGGASTSFGTKLLNLEPGTTYSLRVRAETIDGTEFLAGESFTTPPLPAISNITLAADESSPTPRLNVSWLTNTETTSSLFYRLKDGSYRELSQTEMVKEHSLSIDNLSDNQSYELYLKGIDSYGNQATSDTLTFTTPLDTRAPSISNILIETSNVGLSSEDKAQVAISFNTDEPASCYIEYSEGISTADYTGKTPASQAYQQKHLTIISELKPQTPYNFRVSCRDQISNLSQSPSQAVVSGEVSQSILTIILRTLNNLFGWMGELM